MEINGREEEKKRREKRVEEIRKRKRKGGGGKKKVERGTDCVVGKQRVVDGCNISETMGDDDPFEACFFRRCIRW